MSEIFRAEQSGKARNSAGKGVARGVGGQTTFEYLHRYLTARSLCHGKDVADIAFGEGCGSALLAQVANSLIGVEIDYDAAVRASQSSPHPNLMFVQGDARRLPIQTASVDIVVSFGAPEHLLKQEQFLSEAARILRPDGALVISIPERDVYSRSVSPADSFHVKDLPRDECLTVLRRHFAHLSVLQQRPLLGSVIAAEQNYAASFTTYEKRDHGRIEEALGVPRALYSIVYASRSELPQVAIGSSVYIETDRVDHPASQVAAAQAETFAAKKAAAAARLQADEVKRRASLQGAALSKELSKRRRRLRELERKIATNSSKDGGLARASTLDLAVAILKKQPVLYKASRIAWWLITLQLGRRIAERKTAKLTLQNNYKLANQLIQSGLFDQAWYVKQIPKLAGTKTSKIDAALHYLSHGWRKGKTPNPLFDPAWYIAEYPDVAKMEMEPLAHYLLHGSAEGRKPNPFFEPSWYAANYVDVTQSGMEPLAHYLAHGSREGRKPGPFFDPAWYLAEYSDVANSGLEPLAHYLSHGLAEGRMPSAEWINLIREKRTKALGLNEPLRPTKIALGIVTYNNPPEDLSRCLNSIYVALQEAGVQCEFSVLILDNGAPSEIELSKYSHLRRLDSVGNVGFGAGHNRLMEAAFSDERVEYYLAVNPDGSLEPNALKALLTMAQVSSGGTLVEAIQFPVEHPKSYDPVEFDTPWASGACLLIPRPIYQSIGGFDESFFMYCEDVDLSWRAHAAGFKVKICPRALFFHPTHDRPFDVQIHARFLRAGITLARKWGGDKFEKSLLAQAAKRQIDLSQVPMVDPVEKVPSVVNFDHGFHFARPRW